MAMGSDTWQCLETSLVVTLGMGAADMWMNTRDVANHATVPKETLTTKNCTIKMSVSTMLRPRSLNV